MSKQRPDPDKIANELAGASAFFRPASPAARPPSEPSAPSGDQPLAPPRRPDASPVRPVRPDKRRMIRHPFELYMDQLDRLRELAEDQRRNGEPGSMSRMVRDAIDRFLDDANDKR